jgi:chromate transporter
VSGTLSPPSLSGLFMACARVGLLGFGGVAVLFRHEVVERRRWLTEQEYAEVLGIGQVLPGGNVLNASIQLGTRWHGAAGALAAPLGLVSGPLLVLAGLAMLHDRLAEVPLVQSMLAGTAAAAAGMTCGAALRMAVRLKPNLAVLLVGLAAFAAAGLLRLPLPAIVLGLAPLGVLAAWWGARGR